MTKRKITEILIKIRCFEKRMAKLEKWMECLHREYRKTFTALKNIEEELEK